jgi:hypothetical protein
MPNSILIQLVAVMDMAEVTMMNPPVRNDANKAVLTKSDLLDRAVDVIEQLVEENKMCRMVQS